MHKKPHLREFERFADGYSKLNIIQKEVAKELAKRFDTIGKSIIDIGCGSGEIFGYCQEASRFVAIDKSLQMLSLHPEGRQVELICADFDENILDSFSKNEFDIAFCASSLQWSANLEVTVAKVCDISKSSCVAIFTAGTFSTLRQLANLDNFLPTALFCEEILRKNGFDNIDTKSFCLNFESNLEMFRYIKKSGVGGGRRRLTHGEVLELISSYPLKYLEFEVVFGFRNAY